MSQDNMTIPDMAPYIMGQKYLKESEPYVFSDFELYKAFSKAVATTQLGDVNFDAMENYKDFFNCEPEIKKLIPSRQAQQEVFYALKNGIIVKGVPANCIYMVKKALSKIDSPNLVVKQLPLDLLKSCFTKGYFGDGYTLRDVICNLSNLPYEPLSMTKSKIIYQDFTELYVKETDMVALLPNALAAGLNEDSISYLHVTPDGLMVKDILLRTRGNYIGAVNSIYDLRKLV